MKQWLKKRKGRGFTLVELLIVIVIIGILAGSLLLVMGSGTDKANATKIASDLRTIKAAMLMYYADEGKFVEIPDLSNTGDLNEYLDRVPKTDLGTYKIDANESGDFYVVFVPAGETSNDNVLSILGEMEGITLLSGDVSGYGSRIGK